MYKTLFNSHLNFMFIQAVEEMEKYLQDKILNLPQSNSQVYIYICSV